MNQREKRNLNLSSYLDISKDIQMSILSGKYQPGQKLPPIRKLALEYGVCNNTAARGIAEAQKTGLVNYHRKFGRTVTDNRDAIYEAKKQFISNQINILRDKMYTLGFTEHEIIKMLSAAIENEKISNLCE